MKNLSTGAIILFSLFSCGEDRDEDTQKSTIENQIIGTWTINKKESNGTVIPASLPCENLGNFVFGSDKKMSENYKSVVNNNCVTETDNYTYSVDENNMKITTKNSQNDILIYKVSSLSDHSLVLINTEGSDVRKYTLSK